MKVKNIDYIKKYIATNEIGLSAFCKQCRITKDTLNRVLEGKRISFTQYYKICKGLNVNLKKLQEI